MRESLFPVRNYNLLWLWHINDTWWLLDLFEWTWQLEQLLVCVSETQRSSYRDLCHLINCGFSLEDGTWGRELLMSVWAEEIIYSDPGDVTNADRWNENKCCICFKQHVHFTVLHSSQPELRLAINGKWHPNVLLSKECVLLLTLYHWQNGKLARWFCLMKVKMWCRHTSIYTHLHLIKMEASLNLQQSTCQSAAAGQLHGRQSDLAKANLTREEGAEARDGDGCTERKGEGVCKYIQWAEIDGEKEMDNGKEGNCQSL